MPQITLSNAHGHTVTISGDYDNVLAYLKHIKLLVSLAQLRLEEVGANKMSARAKSDWELLYEAIEQFKTEN